MEFIINNIILRMSQMLCSLEHFHLHRVPWNLIFYFIQNKNVSSRLFQKKYIILFYFQFPVIVNTVSMHMNWHDLAILIICLQLHNLIWYRIFFIIYRDEKKIYLIYSLFCFVCYSISAPPVFKNRDVQLKNMYSFKRAANDKNIFSCTYLYTHTDIKN